MTIKIMNDYADILEPMSLTNLAKAYILWKDNPQEFWDIMAILLNRR